MGWGVVEGFGLTSVLARGAYVAPGLPHEPLRVGVGDLSHGARRARWRGKAEASVAVGGVWFTARATRLEMFGQWARLVAGVDMGQVAKLCAVRCRAPGQCAQRG